MTELEDALADADVDSWLVEAFHRLSRGQAKTLDSFMTMAQSPVNLPSTRATVRTHLLLTDANGHPRVRALCKALTEKVIDYCIPRSRIEEAHQVFVETRSTDSFVRLNKEAKALFTKLEKSGEGGELLLYFLIESVLQVPQILCKMPLKTSAQMHVHGTDGLHAKLLESGGLALYWGESKIHATAKSAIDDCFESVAPFLTGELSEARERDLLLLRDNLDLGSTDLTDALIRLFISDAPEAGKVEFRGACLVGFSHDDYPKVHDGTTLQLHAEVEESIRTWHDRILNRVDHFKLSELEIEVFCVPVPSADEFRKQVKESLELKWFLTVWLWRF